MKQPEIRSQGDVIPLPEESTIARSAEFYARLSACIDQGADIVLNGGAVTRIDTAFIQLLYQVQGALAAAGRRLHWTAASAAIRRSAELLGMHEELALPGIPERATQ